MRAKCVSQTGMGLSEKSVLAGFPKTATFPLKEGSNYTIYGICFWKSTLLYLTIDPDHYMTYPEWFPAELFTVIDGLLPVEWYHKFVGYDDESGLVAIWGYSELVLDPEHFALLSSQENSAIEVFLHRKKEVDEQMNY